MGSLKRLRWLLTPSLLGGCLTIIATIAILASAGWAYINDTQLFYEQLFGAYGVTTVLLLQEDPFFAVRQAIFEGPITYYVLLVSGAIAAGVTIYMVLESISHVTYGASLFLREVHETSEAAKQAARETLIRLSLRITSLAAWVVYILLFFSAILPFSIGHLQFALEKLGTDNPAAWLPDIVISFIVLAVAIHLHNIFARLVFLRLRLIGGLDAEIARLEADDHMS